MTDDTVTQKLLNSTMRFLAKTASRPKKIRFGEKLVAAGVISEEQLQQATEFRGQYQERLTAAGHDEITSEVIAAPELFYAEDYHQQYLAKNPSGYCGIGGTGVSCPVGLED